jgi:predicted secreted protein
MSWQAVIPIFFIIWFFCLFLVLPFGVRTPDRDRDALVPGQAESAPVNFRPWTAIARTTAVAVVLTTLYVLNYSYGWITADDINFFPPPPEIGE